MIRDYRKSEPTPNVTHERWLRSGAEQIEVHVRGQHVWGATRRQHDGAWHLEETIVLEDMRAADLLTIAAALRNAHAIIEGR
jgi:hypothetical protein